MGSEDQAPVCVEHDWVLQGMHLSLTRGVELEEQCGRCSATRYVTDDLRNAPNRPSLPPTRRLLGE